MKALITGSGGFCGTHLKIYLEGMGMEIHTLSQRDYKTPLHHLLPDVNDVGSISAVLASIRPDYIFHLAGTAQSEDHTLYYRLNTMYAVSILKAMEASGLDNCPVLLVGTSAEYGNVSHDELPIREDSQALPYNHYGISKLAQSLEGLAAYRRGLPVVIARPFNVIGTGMNERLVVQTFAAQIVKIKKGAMAPVIKIGNLESTRDFIDVEDAVKIYWKLISSPSALGETVNVCTGKGTSIRDILTRLINISGVEADIVIDRSRYKPVDVPEHYGSTEKMERITGYVPNKDLDITLKRILEWLEHQI
jgi:GDP-4-dehydro-6-deoxy-D-mannose reductase